MFRKVLERLSRQKVLKRKLPKRFGSQTIFVSPDSALRFWYKDLEKTDIQLLKRAEEIVCLADIVWDIGANVGLFAFAAAYVAGSEGKVLAIEADTFLVDLLRKTSSIPHHNRARVEVLPVAISERVGVSYLNIANRGRSANFLEGTEGSTQTGGVREIQMVGTLTLDLISTYYPPPNVLKIDVEGAEDKVLQGGKQLIQQYKPKILIEVSSENIESVTKFFRVQNYKLFDGDAKPSDRGPLEYAVWNTIALPY